MFSFQMPVANFKFIADFSVSLWSAVIMIDNFADFTVFMLSMVTLPIVLLSLIHKGVETPSQLLSF